MPITNIVLQPNTNSLQAAYRPIVLKVEATSTQGTPQPPYVVCDIYIRDVYYKSMLRTAPEVISANSSTYTFDVSDALQEFLQPDIAAVGNNAIQPAMHMSALVYCKFRSSGLDADGFTLEEGTKPVQATKFTAAVSGTGTQSNSFFAINAALQHEDNQDLTLHLNAYKQGVWDNNAYPLTHRKRYFFLEDSSDHFPFIYAGSCIQADIELCYRLKGQSTFNCGGGTVDTNPCAAIDYTIDVVGNRVNVHLNSAPIAGGKVSTRFQVQGGSGWIDGPDSITADYSFPVDTSGTYDIQVTTFCSCCTNAAPIAHTFTIAAIVQNLAWRPIHPACETVNLEQPVYLKTEIRNPQNYDTWFPNVDHPITHKTGTKGDLYVKFFSDAQLLTPLNLTEALTVYVKKTSTINQGAGDSVQEIMTQYAINAAGTEALLEAGVLVNETVNNYSSTTPSVITSTTTTNNTYAPFPNNQVQGGNTGNLGYSDLEQYNTDNNLPTGVTKPNVDTDPDYVAPISDTITCPPGIPLTSIQYGYSLNVMKVELRVGSTFYYGQVVSNTGSGGQITIFSIPADQTVAVTVKAATLDTSNTSGVVKVKVQTAAGSNTYDVPNNIETLLPASFKGITVVNISNY